MATTINGKDAADCSAVELQAEVYRLRAALESAELSCTQARIANSIGKKTKAEQIRFLLFSFELLAKEARAAIVRAEVEKKWLAA